jgi:two-component system, sensor histidine kinase and response regulator
MAQTNVVSPLEKLTRDAYAVYLNSPDKAIGLAEQALKIALESNEVFYEGYCYFLFSKAYWVKTNYKLSTEYGFKALKILKNSTHYPERSECLLGLARTLAELGNFQKAHEFIHESLELGKVNDNENIQANAYREHSYLLVELNQLDSALYYSDKAISLFEKSGDSLDISILYGRKARIYHQRKQFEKSRDYAYRALLIDSLVKNRRALGISYYQIAQNEYALGNRQKGIAQLKKSIRINNEIGNLNWQIKAHELLSSFYLENNMASLAANELLMVSKFKDELYNAEKSGQIQEMQSLHELEAKESTIQLLEQENALKQQQVKNQRLFLAFLLVALLSLTLLIFVLTRLRRIQNITNRNLATKNVAIEEQKMAIQLQAENLRQLDQLKTKLFSVISHDLRGPISNLQSLLDLFTKKLMTADEFITLSERLKENLNITQRTLENLLNWSLSQMGGIKTEKKKIEITSCIDETCLLLEEVASRKNIALNKHFSGPMHVWADANQLQVILRNLIHNAIKFSSFNASIQIKVRKGSDVCRVSIKDSGIGMTEAEINTLIGSKEYFSKTGTEQEKGTGLGLLLCKEFILRNGGDIGIRSTLGAGTEVSFTLLLAEHHTAPQFITRHRNLHDMFTSSIDALIRESFVHHKFLLNVSLAWSRLTGF